MQQELRWGQDAQLPRSGLPVLRHTLAAADGGAQRQCRIIQGPVALSAQLVLLIIVMTALTIKRHRERPRRAWYVFLLDISKQAFSGGAGHLCGMLIAIVAHNSSSASGATECGLYFVVYIMDGTMGITLAIVFHKLMGRAAKSFHVRQLAHKEDDEHEHHWTESLIESGNYGDPPNARRWAIQVGGWVTCVIAARLSVGLTLLATLRVLSRISLALDATFVGHPDLYLFVVMVGIPMMLNVGQAWIQDQVLKWKTRRSSHNGGQGKRDADEDDSAVGCIHSAGEVSALATTNNSRNRASEKGPLLGGL